MRIILTTLTIAFLFALIGAIISLTHWTFGDFIYSFIMQFGFIIIPLFVCVCVFHFILSISKWTKRQPALIIQILALWFIYNLFLFLVNLPDFLRHQNNSDYVHYKSFAEYFATNVLEGFIIATIFSIAIPLFDKLLKNRTDKSRTRHSSDINSTQHRRLQ